MRNRMKKNCIVWTLLLPLLIGCGRKTGGQEEAPALLMLTDSLQKVVSVETVHERRGSRLYLPTAIWKLHGICSTAEWLPNVMSFRRNRKR